MSEDDILKCLIAFVLGFLVARMMRGNGLSVGIQHFPSFEENVMYSTGHQNNDGLERNNSIGNEIVNEFNEVTGFNSHNVEQQTPSNVVIDRPVPGVIMYSVR